VRWYGYGSRPARIAGQGVAVLLVTYSRILGKQDARGLVVAFTSLLRRSRELYASIILAGIRAMQLIMHDIYIYRRRRIVGVCANSVSIISDRSRFQTEVAYY
jgi:hypothetical protein